MLDWFDKFNKLDWIDLQSATPWVLSVDYLLFNKQGEVYIRGTKRVGLISDEEISGLRIGLVKFSSKLLIKKKKKFSSKLYITLVILASEVDDRFNLFTIFIQVFQSAALFDSLTVRENVGFLL